MIDSGHCSLWESYGKKALVKLCMLSNCDDKCSFIPPVVTMKLLLY